LKEDSAEDSEEDQEKKEEVPDVQNKN